MATGAYSDISSSEPRTDERRSTWYALAATPAQRSGKSTGNQTTVEER